MELSRYEMWYGRPDAPATIVPLRAGPISVELENGDIRAVLHGSTEIVRHVRIAIRDVDWLAVPGVRTEQLVTDDGDSFRVGFRSRHRKDDLDIEFEATITGSADGTISYLIDGITLRPFRYSRMGLDVLHPLEGHRGATFVMDGPHGVMAGVLPVEIGPELFAEGFWRPLIGPYTTLRLRLTNGGVVHFEFEGELFEMEDQRNWTDASLKSFCTPLELGYPFDAAAGQRFRQKVTVTYEGPGTDTGSLRDAGRSSSNESLVLVEPGPVVGALSSIGLSMPRHARLPTPREAKLLRALNLDHLRVDLDMTGSRDTWRTTLDRGVHSAAEIGCEVELALVLDEPGRQDLEDLATALATVPVARVLVFDAAEVEGGATSGSLVAAVRGALAVACRGATFAGGSASNFMSLNHVRPITDAMDAVCYPISPQVHSDDDRSVMQNIEVQAETVATARSISGDRPVVVSPITLKPTFNAYASAEVGAGGAPVDLPGTVDSRQMSLFAAAWTVGSIGALAEAGASSATWYQTTGWEGLLETDDGPQDPLRFRSAPGMVFPVYHVFAALASHGRSRIAKCRTSQPAAVRGVILEGDHRRYVLANITARPQQVRVVGLRGPEAAACTLDESTFALAASDPERFRSSVARTMVVTREAVEVEIAPYAVAVLDEVGPIVR